MSAINEIIKKTDIYIINLPSIILYESGTVLARNLRVTRPKEETYLDQITTKGASLEISKKCLPAIGSDSR